MVVADVRQGAPHDSRLHAEMAVDGVVYRREARGGG